MWGVLSCFWTAPQSVQPCQNEEEKLNAEIYIPCPCETPVEILIKTNTSSTIHLLFIKRMTMVEKSS